MEISINKPLARKQKKHKIGCFTKFLSCACCCFMKKGVSFMQKKIKWGIGSDIWNKLKSKLHKKTSSDKIYKILLELYSHKPSVDELALCRISPVSDSVAREDLEFYIPQLWYDLYSNLLLYGFTDTVADITREVLNICSKSFFFSHRILWFILSTDFESVDKPSIEPQQLVDQILEVAKNYSFLHIGNGEKLWKLYESLQIYHTINRSLEGPEESDEVYVVKDILHKYCEGTFNADENDDIDPRFVPIPPFLVENSYMSTIAFVQTLTNISHALLKAQHKTEYLKEELKKLNLLLPSSVYVPFNMFKSRNCAILHIPVSEARVFTTKERAPFKISIEIFRPYKEVKYSTKQPKLEKFKEQRSISVPISNSVSSKFFNTSMTKSLESETSIDSVFEEEDHLPRRRNQTFAMPRDIDFKHYVNTLTADTGSLAAVYGEVDEAGQSISVFKESFKDQAKRIQNQSPFKKFKTWGLLHVIVKSGDDLRQEQLAMQLISFFKQTFVSKGLDLWLYPYDILSTGIDCGILECVPDAVSIDGLKKSLPPDRTTLYDFFLLQFGNRKSKRFKSAKKCFMKSLAGYSLVCYFLQIKDRHNGNILIDRNGHLIHIDFGFMLSNSPGGNINFEQAPFKLTDEFEMILGRRRSKLFQEFRSLCVRGYSALKEKAEQIILMVEMMRTGSASNLGCFIGGEQATTQLRERLLPKQKMSEGDCKEYINDLIDASLDNWSTKCYDRFQYCCQNIFY